MLTAVNEVVTPVYLVGGAVRDIQLGKTPDDFDFATPLSPDEVEDTVMGLGKRVYGMGKRFGTIGFKVNGEKVEVTTFRQENYMAGSRKPEVTYVTNLHADLARRDFTINAMAKAMDGALIDPHKGMADLKAGIIRSVGNPTLRFKEDPLRMIRACRFAAQLGFSIEADTFKSMKKHAHLIHSVARERIVTELDKLLVAPYAGNGVIHLFTSGLMKFILPEVYAIYKYDQNSKYHSLDLDLHTVKVVDGVPAEVSLRYAALFHDIGKPATAKYNKNSGYYNYVFHERVSAELAEGICLRLKFSNDRRKEVVSLVRGHLKEDSPLKEADDAAGKDMDAVHANNAKQSQLRSR
jgi:tRNA nucleotidyltransferase (CCA-adding enzyme)